MSWFHFHKKERFLHPYYIFNFLNVIVTLSYFLLYPSLYAQQENLLLISFAFLSMTNLLNSSSVDFYLSKVFFYVKCAGFVQPTIYKLENVKLLCEPEWEQSADSWFVCFDAPWAADAKQFSSNVFEFLARKHAKKGFNFGRVDVGRFPHLADPLRINTSSMTRHLPAVALFQNGELIGRIPGAGKSSADYKLSASSIEKMFDVAIRSEEAHKEWKKRQKGASGKESVKKASTKHQTRTFKSSNSKKKR